MTSLQSLTTWLRERPPAIRADTPIRPIARDVWDALYDTPCPASLLDALGKAGARHAAWARAGLWLAWHPELRVDPVPPPALVAFLTNRLARLAPVADPATLDAEPERAEELVRLLFACADRRLAGESAEEGEARLREVDSFERRRVLDAAAQREAHARKVREALARKAAEEAAAKATRE
ncbi:MAG: hypothetical protein ACOZNI_33095 [Myxococcota bacterium]